MSDLELLLTPARDLLLSAAIPADEAPVLPDTGNEVLFFHAGAFQPEQHEPIARFLLARPQIKSVFIFGMNGTFWPKELAKWEPCEWHADHLVRLGVPKDRLVVRPCAKNTLTETQAALAEPAIAHSDRVWVLCHDPQSLRVRLQWERFASMPRIFIRPGGWTTDWKRVAQEIFRVRVYGCAGDSAIPSPAEDAIVQALFDRLVVEFPDVYRERVEEMRPFLVSRGLDVDALFAKKIV